MVTRTWSDVSSARGSIDSIVRAVPRIHGKEDGVYWWLLTLASLISFGLVFPEYLLLVRCALWLLWQGMRYCYGSWKTGLMSIARSPDILKFEFYDGLTEEPVVVTTWQSGQVVSREVYRKVGNNNA